MKPLSSKPLPKKIRLNLPMLKEIEAALDKLPHGSQNPRAKEIEAKIRAQHAAG